MTLYKYIRRKLQDDVKFAEFDHNSNFVLEDFLVAIVAHLEIHGYQRPSRMNSVCDRIVNSLMRQ
jgi:hypothetical protein